MSRKPSPPSVTHVIQSGAVGGGPSVVLALAAHLPGRQTVVTRSDGPLLERARQAGLPTEVWSFASKWQFMANYSRFRHQLLGSDILHVHGQWAGFYGSLASLFGKPAVVYTAHMPSFLGSRSRSESLRNTLIELVTCRRASVTVTCSHANRADFLSRRLVNPQRVVTIHNGVEVHPVRPAADVKGELGMNADAPLVLLLGRLSFEKGFDVFLEAVPIIRREVPEARLVVVGDGDQRGPLEARARALGLRASIQFLGSRLDKDDFLRAATVVVIPSRFESSCLVAIEAMMNGVPIVVSEAPALVEAVADGQAGILSQLRPEALASGVLRLLQSPLLRTQLGESGRRLAMRRYSLDRMVAAYSQLYESLTR